MKRMFFVTGTDTGVGKTVLTALMAAYLRQKGIRVAALKPICSGGRDDARLLRDALGGALTLDEINPWHFRKPVAPTLAARAEGKRVGVGSVLDHIRKATIEHDFVLVEGAGGLLSPLGERFDSRDLIVATEARPIIVAPNKLGIISHILLTLEALPKALAKKAFVVLMDARVSDAASKLNGLLLNELGVPCVYQLPWFGNRYSLDAALKIRRVRQTFADMLLP